jgi:CBS domain-containing protein
MQARDIMTVSVETARPDTEVREIAKRLLARHISALPVVDDQGKVVGIVSEGDLMRRPETGTERQPPWWLRMFAESQDRARDFIRSHGRRAKDVMSRDVISVTEDTPLAEIAETLEKHRIKRVPVMREGKLVGIVSRANLLQGLAVAGPEKAATTSDRDLKAAIEAVISAAGLNAHYINVVVVGGVATLWGTVESKVERSALGIAAEEVAGAGLVDNRIDIVPGVVRTMIGN